MSSWGKSWGSSWGTTWGPVTSDPNALIGQAQFSLSAFASASGLGSLHGTASFAFDATGLLENAPAPDGFMVGAATISFAANGAITWQPVEMAPQEIVLPSTTGGVYYDTGKAKVKKDHGWVKATKYGIVGAKAFNIATSSRSNADIKAPIGVKVAGNRVTTASIVKCRVFPLKTSGRADTIAAKSSGFLDGSIGTVQVRASSGRLDWINADELVAILETAL